MTMQTRAFKARADQNGVIRLEVPTDLARQEVEIVVVLQPIQQIDADAMGYSIGYFEETYGSFAHEPLKRHQPADFDVRDSLE